MLNTAATITVVVWPDAYISPNEIFMRICSEEAPPKNGQIFSIFVEIL